jgi:hypothetical protein
MNKLVFLISGQKQTGKDTVGENISRVLIAKTHQLARPVKEIAQILLEMPDSVAFGGEKERRAWKKYGRDGREWLQVLGTEIGREMVHPLVWIDLLRGKVSRSPNTTHVVTDVRFANELAMFDGVENVHVVKIRVTRPSLDSQDGHPSETAQLLLFDDVFDEVVVNEGTLEELMTKVEAIARGRYTAWSRKSPTI